MKFNSKHFKFTIKSRRFKLSVWQKYYSLRKKDKLTEFDKHWVKQLRAQLKTNQFKLIGTHIPSKTSSEWTLNKDISKEKLNKKEYLQKLLLKVQENRKALRKTTKVEKNFDGARYYTEGGIFKSKGMINPLAEHLTTNNPMAVKKPRRKDKNYVGIELEFNTLPGIQQQDIATKLKNEGLARYVDVTTDGSCGWEVRVLLLEDEFEAHLTKIMSVLKGMGFQTNDQCGTHVHLDMRSRDVKVAYSNLFKTQKFLRKFLTTKRKYNSFCKMNKADTFEKQLGNGDRYYGINVASFSRHQTLEVRMHQGTLQSSELIPWINFLIKIVNYNVTLDKTVNTLKQAREKFAIDKNLEKSLEERIMTIFKRKDKKIALDIIAQVSSTSGTTGDITIRTTSFTRAF